MLTNIREQHPVGQGFFHSAILARSDGAERPSPNLTYVYDCGAMPKYSPSRVREVVRFRDTHSNTLDLLFISHLHADHVNGIPDLLQGLRVDTIVMPLLGVIERLIVFASSVYNGAPADGFHSELAADPGAALERFAPRQILLVKRTDDERDDGAPGDEDAPAPDGFAPIGPDGPLGWRLVGKGAVTRGKPEDGSADESPIDNRTFTVEDVNAVAVTMQGRRRWLLAPYVQQGVIDEGVFLGALSAALGVARTDLEADLQTTAYRRMLIASRVKALRQAFEVAARDLNLTSMSLFSGPVPRIGEVLDPDTVGRYHFTAGEWTQSVQYRDPEHIGWLATGDADLLTPEKLRKFLEHYRRLLDRVHTLTVPHHGSAKNSAAPLYDQIRPRFCVTAADAYGNWQHPSPFVIQAIASTGAASIVATSSPASRFMEGCILPN